METGQKRVLVRRHSGEGKSLYPLPKPLGSLAPPGIFETYERKDLPPPPLSTDVFFKDIQPPADVETLISNPALKASSVKQLLPAPVVPAGSGMKFH
eukprot:1704107-Rhodomonas_salina.5